MSLRSSTFSRRTCSGAMYAGVPISWSARVMSASGEARPEPEGVDDGGTESKEGTMLPSRTPARRARPKSSTRTRPSSPMSTLSGLKSRWMRPRSWAAARPWPAATITFTTSRQERSPRSHVRRVLPGTYSMATNACPATIPAS